ncbi:MAG: hypothetical protein DRO11_09150, partial [Methanobacteriota archaeon]
LLFLGILLALVIPKPGVYIYGVAENYPLENYAENLIGARILAIDNTAIGSLSDYQNFIAETSPGDNATLVTDRGEYRVELAEGDNHGVFGILPASALPRYHFLNPLAMLAMAIGIILTGGFFTPTLYTALIPWWGVSLLQWLFALNLGVGLFNLLPAKPLDGGYMLEAAIEKKSGRKTPLRVCWETNGFVSRKFLERMAKLSLETGGTVKVDLKAWTPSLYQALTGVQGSKVWGNVELLAKLGRRRASPPLLVVSTLLVPGYVDAWEVENIAKRLAELDPGIPYSLLAFYPHYMMRDLPTTPRRLAEECYERARTYLENVRIGNVHLLS